MKNKLLISENILLITNFLKNCLYGEQMIFLERFLNRSFCEIETIVPRLILKPIVMKII